MKRRADSEGTVYEDQYGVWWAQLPPDEATGKRPRRRAKTQREAQQLLREMAAERARGTDLSKRMLTVEEFSSYWLKEIIGPTKKETTSTSYAWVLKKYVLPAIGRLALDRVTPAVLQRLVNDLAAQGYARGTIQHVHRRLLKLFDSAAKHRYISQNPVGAVELPGKTDSGVRPTLSLSQIRTLLDAVEGHRLAPLYHCALLLGLRRGELLGLTWRGLDWEAGTLTISQQVLQVGSKTVLSRSTKTTTSARALPLPPRLLERLRRHWHHQQQERALGGLDWREHGLMFPTTNGTPTQPSNLNRHYGLLRERAGLPADVRLHDLRHTCATHLGDLGTEERVIGAILGHSPNTVTASYAKTTLPLMRRAITSLEEAIFDPTASKTASIGPK